MRLIAQALAEKFSLKASFKLFYTFSVLIKFSIQLILMNYLVCYLV